MNMKFLNLWYFICDKFECWFKNIFPWEFVFTFTVELYIQNLNYRDYSTASTVLTFVSISIRELPCTLQLEKDK